MVEISALAGEGGGCTPTPFRPITITYKVAVYAPAKWADTFTLFHLYQYMYSVDLTHPPFQPDRKPNLMYDGGGGGGERNGSKHNRKEKGDW